MWRSGLPWHAIDSCIDNDSFEFIGTTDAQHIFQKQTGLAWDNVNDPPEMHIPCPKCKQRMTVPWTTSGKNVVAWLVDGGELGRGFADRNFKTRCPSCQESVDHDVLRACKFRGDVEQLIEKDVPMPGTLLQIDGMVWLLHYSQNAPIDA